MQMAASVVANEFAGHGRQEKSKPRPSKPERVGHPRSSINIKRITICSAF
jgi:hypothetical protein